MKKIKNIAYLAPEIPALSATFVYNEILSLEKSGFNVLSISVHSPKHPAEGADARALARRTIYLYRLGMHRWLAALIQQIVTNPVKLLRAARLLFADMRTIGFFSLQSLKLLYQFLAGVFVAKNLSEAHSAHLHIHFAHVPTQIGMYAACLANIPFTFTGHANDLFERPLLLQEKFSRSKTGVMISDYNCRYVSGMGIDAKKLRIVRCGIDTQIFNARVPRATGSKRPILGTLGRLVEKKGMDVLIEALALLKKRGQLCTLKIAGDGPLLASLKKQVAEKGLAGVVFFEGAIPHDEVYQWLKTLDCFVLAARRDSAGDQDGIPVVLMEAMAAEVPVISTRISGIPELIEHNISGRLSTPADSDSLAENIEILLDKPSLVKTYISAARQRIVEEFDQQLNTERLIHIFQE